ncbi:S8 family serine peptidase, partial [Candidatus Gracilibacteria bacterium]|nr:S8 family serine peptidase [Candidatus Gracilibacteria bacterium]
MLGGFRFGFGGRNDEEVTSEDEVVVVSENDDTVVFDLGENVDLEETIKELSQDEDVEIVQPIYNYKHFYTPNDQHFGSQQWGYKDQASGISAESGWDVLGAFEGVTCGETTPGRKCGGDPSVKIAVIDSGVNTSASDLVGANFDNANSMMFYHQGNNTCPAGEYYQSFNIGGQFINFCRKIGSQFDEQGHGTKVTSTIAMQDNSIGGLGVAYNTTILPIAVHGQAFNTFFIAESIRYAAEKGAKVINMSLGTPFYDSYLEDAINEVAAQGVIMVAASGNCAVWTGNCDWDGNGVQTPGYFAEANNAVMYPAGFGNVIAVGASDYGASTGGVIRSSYSNFGNHIDVVAPVGDGSPSPSGVLIQCGVPGGVCANNNSFVVGQGTSYASPQVAGVVGLMLSVDSNLDTASVRSIFSQTSKDVGVSGKDTQFGNGLINLDEVMSLLSAPKVTFENPPSKNNWLQNGVLNAFEVSIEKAQNIDLDRVEFLIDDSIVSSDNTLPLQENFDYAFNELGNYIASVRVFDTLGNSSSEEVNLYIEPNWEGRSYVGVAADYVNMIEFNNRIFQTVRGTDNGIYTRSSADGTSWNSWVRSGITSTNPYILILNNSLIQTV